MHIHMHVYWPSVFQCACARVLRVARVVWLMVCGLFHRRWPHRREGSTMWQPSLGRGAQYRTPSHVHVQTLLQSLHTPSFPMLEFLLLMTFFLLYTNSGIPGGEENGRRGYQLTFVIAYIRVSIM